MWRLTELALRNIVSFREAELKIEQGVATLIFGKNEDNASQPCNGSGKSSLIEAISFGLTGEQLRKVKTIEEIINDQADEAYVSLKLINDYNDTIFTIERTITRGKPQVIECHKYNSDGEEIDVANTIQPTVLDYNRYILDEIGLSKDDIYNNFILADSKYESFFDCSDKNKKEIINRFSNGIIIDESIVRLQADLVPVEERLATAKANVTKTCGAIAAIEKELADADAKSKDAHQNRLERIGKIDDQIVKCREEIENGNIEKSSAENAVSRLENLQLEVGLLEESETSLNDSYNTLRGLLADNELKLETDYIREAEDLHISLEHGKKELKAIKQELTVAKNTSVKIESEYKKLLKRHEDFQKEIEDLNNIDQQRIQDRKNQLQEIESQLDSIENRIADNNKRQMELGKIIEQTKIQLSGVITCPNCSHRFFLNSEIQPEEAEKKLSDMETNLLSMHADKEGLIASFEELDETANKIDGEIAKTESHIQLRKKQLENQSDTIHKAFKNCNDAWAEISEIDIRLTTAKNQIIRVSGKINVLRNRLFGEASGLIDGALILNRNKVLEAESNIQFQQGRLLQYQESRRKLIEEPKTDFATSLKASLSKYEEELKTAESVVAEIQVEWSKLKEQEVNFTMFKSYLARKKIDALSLIVNDFLEKIGSDIRLRLEGFTMTKTGKLRDKISVQVMRDGIDCGSYQKFSGGEKARLNLACILSLHTLTNANCEDGKGLDFIIIDELLDKSDEMGMATYCEALNKLGQTSLLITQGAVSESYPHKLLIVKKQGVSSID